MDELEKKLNLFQKAVEQEALEQKTKIEHETKEEKETRIAQAKQKLSEESRYRLTEQKLKVERQYKQITSKEIYLHKKELLLKRDEVISNIFEGVANRIESFMNTKEYYEYLLNCIRVAAEHFHSKTVTVYLKEDDFQKGEMISSALSDFDLELKINSAILLGGVIVKKSGTNLITDETFDHKLKEARENFISQSDLTLEDI